MTHVLGPLNVIETAVPQLAGRVGHGRIAVAGHSLGGFTAALLLGARITDHPADTAWQTALDALTTGPGAFGRVEAK